MSTATPFQRDIYVLRSPLGKCYVGQAACFKVDKHGNIVPHGFQGRWYEHCRLDKDTALTHAIRKHTARAFTVEKLMTCDASKADEYEVFAIVAYNALAPNGYNLRLGGQGGHWKHHDETRKKISKAQVLKWSNADWKQAHCIRLSQAAQCRKRKHTDWQLPAYVRQIANGFRVVIPGKCNRAFCSKCLSMDEKLIAALEFRAGCVSPG